MKIKLIEPINQQKKLPAIIEAALRAFTPKAEPNYKLNPIYQLGDDFFNSKIFELAYSKKGFKYTDVDLEELFNVIDWQPFNKSGSKFVTLFFELTLSGVPEKLISKNIINRIILTDKFMAGAVSSKILQPKMEQGKGNKTPNLKKGGDKIKALYTGITNSIEDNLDNMEKFFGFIGKTFFDGDWDKYSNTLQEFGNNNKSFYEYLINNVNGIPDFLVYGLGYKFKDNNDINKFIDSIEDEDKLFSIICGAYAYNSINYLK